MTEKRRFHHWCYLNEEGKKLYGKIFPDGSVPVLSMIPQMASLGENKTPERIYLVYVPELSEEQFNAIVDLVASKFNAPRNAVEADFKKNGIPLRATLTSGAGTDHPGLFFDSNLSPRLHILAYQNKRGV